MVCKNLILYVTFYSNDNVKFSTDGTCGTVSAIYKCETKYNIYKWDFRHSRDNNCKIPNVN